MSWIVWGMKARDLRWNGRVVQWLQSNDTGLHNIFSKNIIKINF